MEAIPFEAADMTLGGLLAIIIITFITALLKGWIVPKSQNDDTKSSRDYWRKTSINKDKTIWALSQAVMHGSNSSNEAITKVMSVFQEKMDEGDDK